jgi:hypothetical protein
MPEPPLGGAAGAAGAALRPPPRTVRLFSAFFINQAISCTIGLCEPSAVHPKEESALKRRIWFKVVLYIMIFTMLLSTVLFSLSFLAV